MPPSLLLGALADDLTGAVELAGMLVAGGAATLLAVGPDAVPATPDGLHAIVVALKSRVAPPREAEALADACRARFAALNARQVFFKYCATFDSTSDGNIGNMAERLCDGAPTAPVIFCPSYPAAKRTVFRSHMFVADQLLADSPKRHDPLTPMTQSDLRQVLAPQTRLGVGSLFLETIAAGPEAIRAAAEAERLAGRPFLVTDTVVEADLQALAEASLDWPLATGGASIAAYYPALWRARGWMAEAAPPALPGIAGPGAVLAGSCAEQTRAQFFAFRDAGHPVRLLDPLAPLEATVAAALDWATPRLSEGPVALSPSIEPEAVARAQAALGPIEAGRRAEALLGALAQGLIARGVRRLVVAGGESSGAVVQALGITRLQVAPFAALGVGRCLAELEHPLALVLKSGKLGAIDLFASSLAALETPA
ncbi:3-oxo-tetronate kinase [Roseomonas sp. 18066]|uniref:3-oxo-tetronate kinase n=1 Tax=Roseomonas sp. 18066 TaxID=2681412 RepID=UPI00135C8159|nr:3-oxo-tetronate kinase [Roseomonas sp. 18066]